VRLQALAGSQPVVVHSTVVRVVTGTTPEAERGNAHSVADRVKVETDQIARAHHFAGNAISTATPITYIAQSHHRTSSIARILRDAVEIVADRHVRVEQVDLEGRIAAASNVVPTAHK
jgi:hypothetical protein